MDALDVLYKWDLWCQKNDRPDLRKPIFKIIDLLDGITYPGQVEDILSFLDQRTKGPDLDLVRDAVNKHCPANSNRKPPEK